MSEEPRKLDPNPGYRCLGSGRREWVSEGARNYIQEGSGPQSRGRVTSPWKQVASETCREAGVRTFLKCFCPEGGHLARSDPEAAVVKLFTHVTSWANVGTLKNIK